MIRIAAALMVMAASGALAAPAPQDICREAAGRQERMASMPENLLFAVSLAETGRWDEARRESYAWPWTVTSGGDGQFFPTREAAIAEVKRLKARGVTNIDVGCMQINLGHHGEAFGTIEHAFDPAANMAYAASFLRQLYEETDSWTQAAAYYHSRTPEKSEAYKAKVVRLWNRQPRGGAKERPEPEAPIQLASTTAPSLAASRSVMPPRGRRATAMDVSIHARTASPSPLVSAKAPGAIPAKADGPLVITVPDKETVARAETSAPPAPVQTSTAAPQDRGTAHQREMDAWREAQAAGTDASHVALMNRVRKDLERKQELWHSVKAEGGERFAARRRAQLSAWRANQM
ncbi:MAG: transglycosylase SLT domain-containing protein [Magnetospirillum sp. WYHS-4]